MADKPLTLQGSDYAPAVQGLNKAIDRAEGLSLRRLDRSPDYQRSYSFPMLKNGFRLSQKASAQRDRPIRI
jgi:hypothetical protein